MTAPMQPARIADLVIYNGKIATQDDTRSFVPALATAQGEIIASRNDHNIMQWANVETGNDGAALQVDAVRGIATADEKAELIICSCPHVEHSKPDCPPPPQLIAVRGM